MRTTKHCPGLALLLLAGLLTPAQAQDVGRVFPASLPLPLPAAGAMPPDRLRAQNPWNLPLTGAWRFRLTHGQIVKGRYVSADFSANGDLGLQQRNQKPAIECL